MSDWILAHEPLIRTAAFLGIFAGMAGWELLAARRPLRAAKPGRWRTNLLILVVDTTVLRLLFPAAAVGAALLASAQGWGLFPYLGTPAWIAIPASVAVLDLAVYLQHVVFHAVPALWRLHMVHHADVDFDVTTGIRFHPVEIVLSMVYKSGVVVALGAPPVGVLLFEVLLNGTSMFNHGNVSLPAWLDRPLRWVVVTPDMHRVHHSTDLGESNSNFGFNLPWWDRLLGTYRDQPAAGHTRMTIGVEPLLACERQPLRWLLALPFTGDPGRNPINRRHGRRGKKTEGGSQKSEDRRQNGAVTGRASNEVTKSTKTGHEAKSE